MQEIVPDLIKVGQRDDHEIDMVKTALLIASLDSSSLHLERFENHVGKMIKAVAARYKELLDAGAEDVPETQLAALKHVFVDVEDYQGDSEHYDDLQNMNLVRVIERRKGIPAALSILYVHVGLALGWDITALSFPAHVVCRIEKEGKRILFDPFNSCEILDAAGLRRLLKELIGDHVELSSHYYEPSGRRDLLIRLQNNKKLRQIEEEDYDGALQTVEIMRHMAPDEYRLLLDAGVLYARTEKLAAAVEALQTYIDKAPDDVDSYDAALLLRQIKENIN